MIHPTILSALLFLAAPASVPIPDSKPEPAPELSQAKPKPLSLEDQAGLRCSAAFAIVARGQAKGAKNALAYPALDQRGREFFVRTSARLMDATGMDRNGVASALEAAAQQLRSEGGPEKIMPSCLLMLEGSGL